MTSTPRTTPPTARATGHREDRDGTPYVVFERTFAAPIADVWAAVTESDRLVRWIGRWTGDPASGSDHVLHDGRVPGRARRDDPHRRVHGAVETGDALGATR